MIDASSITKVYVSLLNKEITKENAINKLIVLVLENPHFFGLENLNKEDMQDFLFYFIQKVDKVFNNFNPGDLSNIMGASVNHNNNDFSLDGLVAKALMNLVGVGLTEDNYAKYSNVFSEGREFVNGSKVMVIHGTADTTVPHSNADVVEKNVKPGILVHKWDAELQPHAFIVVGIKKDEYKGLVKNYLNCLNDSSCVQITK